MFFFFRFFILKVDCIFKKLKESPSTRAKYRKMNLSDMMPVILSIVHKRWFSHKKLSDLKSILTRRKKAYEKNIIKVCLLNLLIKSINY